LRKERVVISGSSSVIPIIQKLAAEYERDNDVRIIINMSSSGAGIADTQNGLNDFGLSSRYLKESERGVFEQVLCYDGIALVVGSNSSATDVTYDEVKNLYANGSPITAQNITAGIGRDSGSGTRSAFDELMAIDGEYHTSISTLAETGNVIEALSPTTTSLGYISFGSLTTAVKALSLNGVECTAENIKSGSYSLFRPFVIVQKKDKTLSETAQNFLNFIFSPTAHRIIEGENYIPIDI
jgi:phosphate transport system substrate-binding protein